METDNLRFDFRVGQEHFANLSPQTDVEIEVEQRLIRVRKLAEDVAWFDFAELCDGPRSQNDYIELARVYHAVLVADVPQFTTRNEDSARRFISLVDEFYDRNIKLILSAEVPILELYAGKRLKFEFERCISKCDLRAFLIPSMRFSMRFQLSWPKYTMFFRCGLESVRPKIVLRYPISGFSRTGSSKKGTSSFSLPEYYGRTSKPACFICSRRLMSTSNLEKPWSSSLSASCPEVTTLMLSRVLTSPLSLKGWLETWRGPLMMERSELRLVS